MQCAGPAVSGWQCSNGDQNNLAYALPRKVLVLIMQQQADQLCSKQHCVPGRGHRAAASPEL